MTCCAMQGLGDGLEGLEGLTQSLANLGNSQSMLAYDPFGATDTQVYTLRRQNCMIPPLYPMLHEGGYTICYVCC